MRTLTLDFDGVVHSYPSGWKGATVIDGEPVAGLVDFLREAVKHFTVCIYSSRSHQEGGIDAMRRWLQSYMTDDRGVFDALQWPTHKPGSFVSIDDRGLLFTGTWPSVAELLAFKTWQGK